MHTYVFLCDFTEQKSKRELTQAGGLCSLVRVPDDERCLNVVRKPPAYSNAPCCGPPSRTTLKLNREGELGRGRYVRSWGSPG